MKHIIAVLLENEPGALSRVVGLFSARGYNIESLTVAEVAHGAARRRLDREGRNLGEAELPADGVGDGRVNLLLAKLATVAGAVPGGFWLSITVRGRLRVRATKRSTRLGRKRLRRAATVIPAAPPPKSVVASR